MLRTCALKFLNFGYPATVYKQAQAKNKITFALTIPLKKGDSSTLLR